MYACYRRDAAAKDAIHYVFKERVSLFGCIQGFIPWMMMHKTPEGQAEPFKWHVDVRADLAATHQSYADCSLLIDLKPKQNKTNLSLYEVMDVWGFSSNGWTPILLRLDGLFVDADPSSVNRHDFVLKDEDRDGPIYEFLYLDGTVGNGQLWGTWAPPPASPTNAALLWPEALQYFLKCIREQSPDLFEA